MNHILQALQNHKNTSESFDLKTLLANKSRNKKLQINLDSLQVDFSKNFIDESSLNLFDSIAEKIDLESQINKMMIGQKVNFTENRAALHTALRNPKLESLNLDGIEYITEIKDVQKKAFDFVNKIRNGELKSFNNKTFKYVVNIGIGGSYLGTKMAYYALASQDSNYTTSAEIIVHFVSNVDSHNLIDVLNKIELDRTLFVIASKTFTTQETLLNAENIKDYFVKNLPSTVNINIAIQQHFCALSTNLDATNKFGIKNDFTFAFWDFIGGRYSIWSSIALPLMIKIGVEKFQEFLSGAYIVDKHIKSTQASKNIPVLMAFISTLYNNIYNYNSYAVIPYDYRLQYFTQYIQQLEMESNGKSVNKNGEYIDYKTSPVIWGEVGTDSQHSFFQMLHQGTTVIPCDFIAFVNPNLSPVIPQQLQSIQHNVLIANMLAQTEALALGRDLESTKLSLQGTENMQQILPHKVFLGNRPNNIFMFEKLTPKALGMLCALYEHKIFVQSVFWEINAFDQMGVELGKELSKNILNSMDSKAQEDNVNFTILKYIQEHKQQ